MKSTYRVRVANTIVYMQHRSQSARANIWLVCSLLFLVAPQAQAQESATPAQLSQIDSYLEEQVKQKGFSGTVLVGIDGEIAFEKGFGLANADWLLPNSPSTRFRIASLTKQFTAASILLLQERGQLTVQDQVSKYIPDLPQSWRSITLHELLTHTSGIPNYAAMSKTEEILNRTGAKPRELVDLAASKPLEFKPGARLHYTNTGYVLLGMVIEKVSGLPYGEFLQKNIFTPLKMMNSGYEDQSKILEKRASGYMLKNGMLRNADFIDMSIPYG